MFLVVFVLVSKFHVKQNSNKMIKFDIIDDLLCNLIYINFIMLFKEGFSFNKEQ